MIQILWEKPQIKQFYLYVLKNKTEASKTETRVLWRKKNAGVTISGLKNQDKTAAAAGSAELSFLAKDIL